MARRIGDGAGRGGKTLTEEDRALWRKVADTAKPLPGRAAALRASSAAPAAPEEPRIQAAPSKAGENTDRGMIGAMRAALAGSWKGSALDGVGDRGSPPSTGRRSTGPNLHPIEKPVHRKLTSGRVALEARIDLHGMAEAEAHAVLLDFLRRSWRGGARHVLVITGKGSSGGSRGVLKRMVPRWLSQPDFAAYVAGHAQAGRGHGGEGALYIRLKRQSAPPSR